MNLTMAMSCLFGMPGQGALSVGRVQTPTLKLVVDRDEKIENFKAHDYFVLLAEFTNKQNDTFLAKWQVPETLADEAGHCLKREVVDEISRKIECQKATVIDFSEKNKKTKPPLCFSLSNLQKLASSQLGLSAKETLKTAQALYEKHKATTYPRTDCGYLPESQFLDAAMILTALVKTDDSIQKLVEQCDCNERSPIWNDKKITAHHGIIPTSNFLESYKQLNK